MVSFRALIASMIVCAFGQSFSLNDVQLRRASGVADEDVQVFVEQNGAVWPRQAFSFFDLYMLAGDVNDGFNPTDHTYLGNTLSGTSSSAGTALTGVGTHYTTELAVAAGVSATIIDSLGQICIINTITDDTHATLVAAPGVAFNASTLQRIYDNNYWGKVFGTAFDVLQALCTPFGLVPRYYFGQDDGSYLGDGTDRHHIELLSRGRALGLVNPIGPILNSLNQPTSPYYIQAVQSTCVLTRNPDNWYVNNGVSNGGTPPSSVKSDISFSTQLSSASTTQLTYRKSEIWCNPVGYANYVPTNMTRYYNYKTGALVGPLLSTPPGPGFLSTDSFMQAICEYHFNKFHGQSSYTREYGTVQARDLATLSVTQWNLRPMRRHQITDEKGTRTYYAIEVRKDYYKNRAKVVWFEE